MPILILRSSAQEPELPYSLPTAGNAVAIGTNDALDVYPAAEGWTEAAWNSSLFISYGGGAIVEGYSEHGAYVLAGTGGHGHPDNHGAAVFDFSTALWARQDNSQGVARLSTTPWRYDETTDSNGSPWYEVTGSDVPLPAHPYANLVASASGTKGSVVYVTRTAVGAGAANSGGCHRFDLNTRAWSRVGSSTSSRLTTESDSILDTARNRVWLVPNDQHSYQNVQYFDLSDNTFKTTASQSGFPSSDLSGANRTMLYAGYLIRNCGSVAGLWIFDPDNATAGWVEVTVSGTLPSAHNQWAPYNGKLYTLPKTGGNTLTRITPPADPVAGTWTVATESIGGASLPAMNGAVNDTDTSKFTRLHYVPSIDCLTWIPGGTESVYLLKPS